MNPSPTGTAADITDGSVHWAWFAAEARQHGYRPNAVRGWSALYGVGMADNIILRGNVNPEFLHEFEGLNTPNYTVDTGAAAVPKFTLDKSGTDISGNYDPANTGGGDYKPLAGSPDRPLVAVGEHRRRPARRRASGPVCHRRNSECGSDRGCADPSRRARPQPRVGLRRRYRPRGRPGECG